MAHFAKINEQNEVLSVVYIEDNKIMSNGVESEQVGQQYLETNNNWPANLWIKTSYNTFENNHRDGGTPFRGNYACIGYTWDAANNIFWPEKPYASWVKDVANAKWTSPIGDAPALTDEQVSQNTPTLNDAGLVQTPPSHGWIYVWNETNGTWDLVDNGWVASTTP